MRFELYRARRGLLRRTQWRWRLIARNGRILAVSAEGYNNRRDALSAIVSIRAEAPLAQLTGEK